MHTVANTEIQIHQRIEDPHLNHDRLRYGGGKDMSSPQPPLSSSPGCRRQLGEEYSNTKEYKEFHIFKNTKFKIQKYKDTKLL